MKLAIVHDFLNQYGGAERVIEALHEIFPNAPIYTSIYFPQNMPDNFKNMDIKTSFMQKLPGLKKHSKRYFLLYPIAFRNFNFNNYDVVLSLSSSYAKGIKVHRHCLHICYCYTPPRFIWNYEQYINKENINTPTKKLIFFLIQLLLKKWDIYTSKSVNHFIAISENIKNRIRTTYQRVSTVIYPPVNVQACYISKTIDNYFLVVSRLNAYKQIDIVIKSFNELRLPLRIIGDGPYKKTLQAIANKNIEFLGRVSEEILLQNYAHCQALIFPGEEDFGIAPVEAQASGRPVIAYASGGALETVINGVTGIFFERQTVKSLVQAVEKFKKMKHIFDSNKIRQNSLKYDKEVFKQKIYNFILRKYEEFRYKV